MFKALLWTTAVVGYSAALLIGTTGGMAINQGDDCKRACLEARAVLSDPAIIIPGVLAMALACVAVFILAALALKAERRTYSYRSRKITDELVRAARLQH